MKRILLICPYPENKVPGQRLKYEQYFGYLRDHGYDIDVHPFFTEKTYSMLYRKGRLWGKVLGVLGGYLRRLALLPRIRRYDGVYIFLHVTPFGPPIFERLYSLLARKIVYDIDDLVFLGKTSAYNRITGLIRGRRKPLFLMKAADHVITCTPYLDGIARRHNPRTTDISSTIRTDDYLPVNPYANDRPVTLGWSGSHSTAPYLRLLSGVLRRLRALHEFRLKVIGDADFTLEGVEVRAQAWNEPTEVRDLQEIDIGLYPLPDEEWVLGKSGLKALQYMALGIPTVATAIGANFRVMENGVSGFLVCTEEEWLDCLDRLIRSPDLRRKIGGAARERVERLYSVRANAPVYLRIFRETFGA